MSESTEALVERVRRNLDHRAMHGPEAVAALTELAERLKAAERQNDADQGWTTARDWKHRAEAAEAQVAELVEALEALARWERFPEVQQFARERLVKVNTDFEWKQQEC